eukprot:scaffold268963_cov26-Tisochrysis_lutea.AAC.2
MPSDLVTVQLGLPSAAALPDVNASAICRSASSTVCFLARSLAANSAECKNPPLAPLWTTLPAAAAGAPSPQSPPTYAAPTIGEGRNCCAKDDGAMGGGGAVDGARGGGGGVGIDRDVLEVIAASS